MADWWARVEGGDRAQPRYRVSRKAGTIEGAIEAVGDVDRARAEADDEVWNKAPEYGLVPGQQTWSPSIPIERFLKGGDGPLRGLSPQEMAFVNAMIETWDWRRSALAAGYGIHDVNRLKHKKAIGRAIVFILEKRARENAVTKDVVLTGLLREARGEFTDSNGETDSTPASRVAAWRALGEHLQLFVAKVEVEGSHKVKIVSDKVLDADSWTEIYGDGPVKLQPAVDVNE